MTNLIVVLMVSFHTNCAVHSSYPDGRREARCVVERVCSVNHDLGDGNVLQLSVTNVVDEFQHSYRVRKTRHPILGASEQIEVLPPTPQPVFRTNWAESFITSTNITFYTNGSGGIVLTPAIAPR